MSKEKELVEKISPELMAHPRFMEYYNYLSSQIPDLLYQNEFTIAQASANISVSPDGKKVQITAKGKSKIKYG